MPWTLQKWKEIYSTGLWRLFWPPLSVPSLVLIMLFKGINKSLLVLQKNKPKKPEMAFICLNGHSEPCRDYGWGYMASATLRRAPEARGVQLSHLWMMRGKQQTSSSMGNWNGDYGICRYSPQHIPSYYDLLCFQHFPDIFVFYIIFLLGRFTFGCSHCCL